MTHKVPLRSRNGSARVAVTAIVASIAVGTLLAVPASATENRNELLQLSRDGVNFATGPLPPMFRSTQGYVPGESRRALIWVRNASKHTAHFSVAVRNTGMATNSALPGHLFLQVQSHSRSSSATFLPAAGTCTPIIDDWTLAGGAVLPLTVELGLQLEAPGPTKKQTAEFSMIYVLQEQGPGKYSDPCSGRPGNPQAGNGLATIVVGGGAPGTANYGEVPNINGSVAGVDDAADSLSMTPDQSSAGFAPDALPLDRQLQSNVEITAYNPWTWIVVVGVCLYIFKRSRKRSTTT